METMLNIAEWLWTSGNEAVGGPGWRIVLRPRPVPDRLEADFCRWREFLLNGVLGSSPRGPRRRSWYGAGDSG